MFKKGQGDRCYRNGPFLYLYVSYVLFFKLSFSEILFCRRNFFRGCEVSDYCVDHKDGYTKCVFFFGFFSFY